MTCNNMELSSAKQDESYINNYQTYMKQKSGFESFLHGNSTPTTETKIANNAYKDSECKICSVIGKPGDLPRVLNQGLYYKYTSSQDFFYTKDLTSILEKKRQPVSIKYYDDIIYDEDKEHLKVLFKLKDSRTLMNEIKEFYSQFYLFPRNFQKPFFRIMNTNIARHRRIEYVKVFQNNSPRETLRTKNSQITEIEFNFMQMLGETFLRDNYRETSTFTGERPSERRSGFRRETEQYIKEMEANFNMLRINNQKYREEEANKFSNALYNKQYMLYSRNDSETAEEFLRSVLHGFRTAEKNSNMKHKEVKVIKVEPVKKDNRDKNKVLTRSRPQSPASNLNLRKFQSEQNSILKEIMKDAGNGRNEMDYLAERVHNNEIKTTREILGGETNRRLIRPESVTNLHRHKNLHGNLPRKEPKGTNLIPKFSPNNLQEAVYDRESIMNQVSHLRSSQNRAPNYKSEERKNHTPIETHYKPSPVCEDGSSTATSKQVKVSYVNSPTGFKSHSSLETLIMKKQEEKFSKIPLIRPEVVIPHPYAREPRVILKRGDSLAGFDSTKSNRSKDSKNGADSSTSRKVIKTSKSNPRSLNRQLDRDSPFGDRGHGEIVSLKKAINIYDVYQPIKKPYFEHEIPELIQKIVPPSKHVRSVSSGIKKLRFDNAADWKKEDSLRKGNISISGTHQNISASYRSVGPNADNLNPVKVREEQRNYESQRIAEIYSQATNVRRRKAKSSANILVNVGSISKVDLSGKESKRSLNADIESGHEGRKFTFRDIKELMEVWSPKMNKNLSSKSPIKIQPNKVPKHQRYASRG